MLLVAAMLAPAPALYARKPAAKASTSAQSKKGRTGARKGSKSGARKGTSRKKGSTRKGATETSADVRRREEATRREIRQTQQQIQVNDAEIKKNLAELGKLEDDIKAGKVKVAQATKKVNTLQSQINGLQSRISRDEATLAKLRSEYLKAVKRMRVKRKSKSMLAFVFSSGSFNEAVRRMRYMKRVSDWRDRQTREIGERVAELKTQTEALSRTKTAHDHALAENVKAQKQLQSQFDRQDAIVVDLRRNGQALQAHLSKKQAEANALKGRVAALIAEETRKAEAEERARAAAEAQARAEAAERERAAAALAAEQRAREEERQREAELLAQNEARKSEAPAKAQEKKQPKKETPKPKKETPKKETPKKETPRKETPKKETQAKSSGGEDVSYAQARRRKPRSQTQKAAPSAAGSVNAAKSSNAARSAAPARRELSDFGSMRGSLPRPVAGQFRVTSRFGTHSLPDMPNVTYDNPGIDAEVAPGATAQAVYGGKVSGVYVVDGYSTVVIVNHGGYYTVYGNIASPSVSVGESVRQGQGLGRLATDSEDPSHSTIHFEVWRNRDKMDPLGWIR